MMAGKKYHPGGQSFTFVKENGSLTLRSNITPKQKYHIHNDEVYERRLIHKFALYEYDDPEIACAEPIIKWQATEMGQWVMKHCLDPTFQIYADAVNFGYQIAITAHVTPKRWTEFCLRFS